jgi:hypothetical protein
MLIAEMVLMQKVSGKGEALIVREQVVDEE